MNHAIAILLMSGTRERLQMGGMLASVAAVSDRPVKVFVSMNALPCFLQVAGSAGSAGPADLADLAEGPAGRRLEQRGPPYRQLFADAVELGDASIHPCSLAMELLDIQAQQLEPYFGAPMGLTGFMEIADGCQVWCL